MTIAEYQLAPQCPPTMMKCAIFMYQWMQFCSDEKGLRLHPINENRVTQNTFKKVIAELKEEFYQVKS